MYIFTAVSLSILAGLAGLIILYAAQRLKSRGDAFFLDTCVAVHERDQATAELETIQSQLLRAEHARKISIAAARQAWNKACAAGKARDGISAELAELRSQLARNGKRHHTNQMVHLFDDLSSILLDTQTELDIFRSYFGALLAQIRAPAMLPDYLEQFYSYESARLSTGSEAIRNGRVHPCAYKPKSTAARLPRPGVAQIQKG